MGPPKLPGAPWPGLGRPRKSTPEGNKIEPRGDQNGVREASGGFWAPGVPQMAAQAALRPHVGGSCGPLAGSRGRLGEPLAPLGALLGLPGGSPEARGELREVILEGILKVEPEIWENHKVLTCSMV